MSAFKRGLLWGAALAALFVAAAGFLHSKAGRPLLAKLGVPCPANKATADQVAAVHELGLTGLRGTAAAPARPAHGFALDRMTLADAQAWAAAKGATCVHETRGFDYLRCRSVSSEVLDQPGLPPVSELWLSFGKGGTLLSLDVYRRGLDEAAEEQVWQAATSKLEQSLGAPTHTIGKHAKGYLAAGPLHTARVQYRYADYIATVTAANLPWGGLAVREQFQSARSGM